MTWTHARLFYTWYSHVGSGGESCMIFFFSAAFKHSYFLYPLTRSQVNSARWTLVHFTQRPSVPESPPKLRHLKLESVVHHRALPSCHEPPYLTRHSSSSCEPNMTGGPSCQEHNRGHGLGGGCEVWSLTVCLLLSSLQKTAHSALASMSPSVLQRVGGLLAHSKITPQHRPTRGAACRARPLGCWGKRQDLGDVTGVGSGSQVPRSPIDCRAQRGFVCRAFSSHMLPWLTQCHYTHTQNCTRYSFFRCNVCIQLPRHWLNSEHDNFFFLSQFKVVLSISLHELQYFFHTWSHDLHQLRKFVMGQILT